MYSDKGISREAEVVVGEEEEEEEGEPSLRWIIRCGHSDMGYTRWTHNTHTYSCAPTRHCCNPGTDHVVLKCCSCFGCKTISHL